MRCDKQFLNPVRIPRQEILSTKKIFLKRKTSILFTFSKIIPFSRICLWSFCFESHYVLQILRFLSLSCRCLLLLKICVFQYFILPFLGSRYRHFEFSFIKIDQVFQYIIGFRQIYIYAKSHYRSKIIILECIYLPFESIFESKLYQDFSCQQSSIFEDG